MSTTAPATPSASEAWPEWVTSGRYDAIDTFTAKNGQTYYVVTKGRTITAYTAEACIDDVRIGGYVSWGGWNPTIGNMSVRPNHQRQGIATELLRRAREIEPDLRHSDRLSNDARAWLKGIGEAVPSPKP